MIKLTQKPWILADLCFTTFSFLIPLLFFFPEITHIMNQTAITILNTLIPNLNPELHHTPFLFSNVTYLSSSGGIPTDQIKLAWGGGALLCLHFTTNSNLSIPFKSILLFFALTLFATSVISYFFPQTFPYTIASFSEIVMKLNVLLWFVFPVMLSALLAQFPIHPGIKFLFIGSLISLIIVFGAIKYAFSLYILLKGSFILTPIVFFIFGPYIDLVYLVSFFALLISRLKT